MSFDANDRARDDGSEQMTLDDAPAPVTSSSRKETDRQRAQTSGAVRARGPASERQPSGETPVINSPPLHDDHPDADEQHTDKPQAGIIRRHPFAAALGLLALLAAVPAGYVYWDYGAHFASTDDAFIAARQFAIAPQVSGSITAVPVTDNQHVAAGGVIARIDDRSYRIALDQAKAQLAHDQSLLAQAQKNLGRYQYLAKTNSIARQQVDDQTFLVGQDKAIVALDQTKVDAAELNLSYTTLTAAQAGRVVSLSGAVGQYAQAGTTLAMFVPDQIWVTANFKETQLAAMRPGQPVTIDIDAYPGRAIRGHVASIQSGSGPAFSLLPPENATGNWVKVVQRVPVKIVMDNAPSDVALGPGMSVEATVRVNPSPSLYERLKGWFERRP